MEVSVGDLIRVMSVLCNDKFSKCPCWFCETGNTRIGTVLSERYVKVRSLYEFDVLFGSEIYTIYENEAEVLSAR